MQTSLAARLEAVLDEVAEDLVPLAGTEAAGFAIAEIRARAGGTVYPSLYRVESERLWLIAQAGYTGVYDGIGLDRGVMARAVATGETQFVADASEVGDYLHAQTGFVSEVTCLDRELVFNIETTEPLDESIVAVAERFTSELGDRVHSAPDDLRRKPLSHLLGSMVAETDPGMIASAAGRIAAVHLDLEVCHVAIHGDPPIHSVWRTPGADGRMLSEREVRMAVEGKRAYASWIGPASELGLPEGDVAVLPLHRRGETIGGIVGVGPDIPATDSEYI